MSTDTATPSRVAFEAIGTSWVLTSEHPIDAALRRTIDDVIADYDATWSRFRGDSAVSRLGGAGGTADLGPHAPALLGVLLALESVTGGSMTPLIGGSLEHLGYDASYRMRARPGWLPAPPAGRLRLTGSIADLDGPAVLDVGSAGKGQLVDLVGAALGAAGHDRYLVDGGRDLLAVGEPVTVALEHPYDPTRAIGVVELSDAALCGSGVNLRRWDSVDGRGRLHHVLDGRTGRPVQTMAATWVLASTALMADALSTALFFAEPDLLRATAAEHGWGTFEYARMTTNGVVAASAGLPGEVFR